MKQFTLKGNQGNECSFTFNEGNWLIEFKADQAMEISALTWLLQHLPVTYSELENIASKFRFKLVEVQLDLSFDRFWIEYDFKMGSKDKCKKLWEGLNDGDKSLALAAIGKYNRYLKLNEGVKKVYPERYISHKRFENQF